MIEDLLHASNVCEGTNKQTKQKDNLLNEFHKCLFALPVYFFREIFTALLMSF